MPASVDKADLASILPNGLDYRKCQKGHDHLKEVTTWQLLRGELEQLV